MSIDWRVSDEALNVAGWLAFAEPKLRAMKNIDADAVLDDLDIDRLHAALALEHLPSVNSVFEMAAEQLHWLLAHTPFEALEWQIAIITVEAQLRRYGYRLERTLAGSRREIESGAQNVAETADLLVANSTRAPAWTPPPTEPPRVYVSVRCGPVVGDDTEETRREAHADAAAACSAALNLRFEAEAPAVDFNAWPLPDAQADLVSAIELRDATDSRKFVRSLLKSADAIVYIRAGGGSHGTGRDEGEIPVRTVRIALRRPGDPESSCWAAEGIDSFTKVVDLGESEPASVISIVEETLRGLHAQLLRARDNRVLRTLRYGEKTNSLLTKWTAMSPADRERALVVSGLPPGEFLMAFDSTGYAMLTDEVHRDLDAAMGLSLTIGRVNLTATQKVALADFCEWRSLTFLQRDQLEDEAERQLALNEHRWTLANRLEWLDFARAWRQTINS